MPPEEQTITTNRHLSLRDRVAHVFLQPAGDYYEASNLVSAGLGTGGILIIVGFAFQGLGVELLVTGLFMLFLAVVLQFDGVELYVDREHFESRHTQ
ncbi:hypothetical protein OB905_13120 [Halobacteria archaeon AArc-dxtr1]|nr:hypothetical protein [Halobacteria archaeon AArc-dxtr1]